MNGHLYTAEQDDFIRHNYVNVGVCTREFNKRFDTNLSYSAIKSHAFKKIGIKTGYRPWTDETNSAITSILLKYPYKQATKEFNKRFGTNFTQKQIQSHCTRCGIKREYATGIKQIDKIISENIDKSYEKIRKIIYERTGKEYRDYTAVCVRANNLGLNRPHRVWHVDDNRTICGEKVTFSEYVTFISNRWHRIATELQPLALQVARLQAGCRNKTAK